jgi:pectin methylesterase-like acyl-CoA thioesterase
MDMKGKLERLSRLSLAIGFAVALSACATAPPQELSILDAMSPHSLGRPQSCEAMNTATVCIQTMRLSKNKSCSCADRRAISDGNFAPGF